MRGVITKVYSRKTLEKTGKGVAKDQLTMKDKRGEEEKQKKKKHSKALSSKAKGQGGECVLAMLWQFCT